MKKPLESDHEFGVKVLRDHRAQAGTPGRPSVGAGILERS